MKPKGEGSLYVIFTPRTPSHNPTLENNAWSPCVDLFLTLSMLPLNPLSQANDALIGIWNKAGKLPTMDQLWLQHRAKVEQMQDDMLSWGPAERAEGERMLDTLAGLLQNVGPYLGLQPTIAAWRGHMKVRLVTSIGNTML